MKIKYIDSLDMSGFFGNITQSARGAASDALSSVAASETVRAVGERGREALSKVAASGVVRAVGERGSEALSRVAASGVVRAVKKTTDIYKKDIAGKLRDTAQRLEDKGITDVLITGALTIIEEANARRNILTEKARKLTEQVNEQLTELKGQAEETTINLICSKIQINNDDLQKENEALQEENNRLSIKSLYSIIIVKELVSLSIKILLLDILFNIIKYNKQQYESISDTDGTIQSNYQFIRQIYDYEYTGEIDFPLIYSRIIYDENSENNNITVSEQNGNIETITTITYKHIDIYNLLLENVKQLIGSTEYNIGKIKENKYSEGNTGEESIINYIVDQLEILNKAFENSKYELIPGRKEKVQGGGKYQPKKMNKKEILGKERCIYKKQGDKREYVKYKSELITVKDFKIIMAKKNKNNKAKAK